MKVLKCIALATLLAWPCVASASQVWSRVDLNPAQRFIGPSLYEEVESSTLSFINVQKTYSPLILQNYLTGYSFVSSGFGSAYSDLRTGRQGAMSVATNLSALSQASWSEDIQFNIAGADPFTSTEIIMNLAVHGTLNGGAGGYTFGAGNGQVSFNRDYSGFSLIPTGLPGFSSFSYWNEGDTTFMRVGVLLTGATPTLHLNSTLQASAHSEAFLSNPPDTVWADFGHTATFGWDLPDNVTFTSGSGQFLSAITGVPEPSTWGLMLIGFGSIGGAMRSAKRRQKLTASYA